MLAQISSEGEITVRPVRILLPDVIHGGTIFFDSNKRLHIIAADGNYHRLIVNYENLIPPSAKPSRTVSMKVSRFFWHELFTTDRPDKNFLAASVPSSNLEFCSDNEKLIAYKLDAETGRILSNRWIISPEIPERNCIYSTGLASKDGRVAFFSGIRSRENPTGVSYLQELGPEGKPNSKPYEVHFFADEAQLTNDLGNQTRLIAYAIDNRGGGGDDYPDQVFVRSIQLNKHKIGPRYKVNGEKQFIYGTKRIVIDPKGRFVLFSMSDYPTESCSVYYRALDPGTGKPVGKMKELIPRACTSINLVEDPQ